MNIKDLMTKLSEIENRIDTPVYEVISQAEQNELTKLYLKLNDPRYASNQDVAREIDRYNSVMKDVDKYANSTFQPGSDQPGMPEVPRKPMPGEKTKPGGDKPLTGNQPAIMKMQKELKAAGADLGTFGPNKDGIDGNLGGKNSKTRLAMQKFPDIAKKYGFPVSGQAPMADPKANTKPELGFGPDKTAPQTYDDYRKISAQQDAAKFGSTGDGIIATNLFNSMNGLGTDDEMFFRALTQIKSPKQFANVSRLYKAGAGEELIDAIKGDFGPGELIKIKQQLRKLSINVNL